MATFFSSEFVVVCLNYVHSPNLYHDSLVSAMYQKSTLVCG